MGRGQNIYFSKEDMQMVSGYEMTLNLTNHQRNAN